MRRCHGRVYILAQSHPLTETAPRKRQLKSLALEVEWRRLGRGHSQRLCLVIETRIWFSGLGSALYCVIASHTGREESKTLQTSTHSIHALLLCTIRQLLYTQLDVQCLAEPRAFLGQLDEPDNLCCLVSADRDIFFALQRPDESAVEFGVGRRLDGSKDLLDGASVLYSRQSA